ncbi:CoA pyrophosphatase [Candidatus Kapaibacterium sp.]
MLKFIDFLKKRTKSELPGLNSHLKMAPKRFQRSFRNLAPSDNAKESAVLILLCEVDNMIHVVLTLRSETLNKHGGQISFPGGRIEVDESPVDAALRETNEEIGIDVNDIEIICKISDLYVPPSNSLIHPFVGKLKCMPKFDINADEVEECFVFPIDYFVDESNLRAKSEILEGYEVELPYWDVKSKNVLWGATSMILAELLDLYREYLNESGN